MVAVALSSLVASGAVWRLGEARGAATAERVAGELSRQLGRAAIHEWFFDSPLTRGPGVARSAGARRWWPPLTLLAWLAGRLAKPGQHLVWVGARCWPTPDLLHAAMPGAAVHQPAGDVPRWVFLCPKTPADRLWAIDQSLRCPAVGAVVADGAGLTLPMTRRLHLAAEAGGTIGLIARPPWEQGSLSAAQSRWRVGCRRSEHDQPEWLVELLRCKGLQPVATDLRWQVQWNREEPHETGAVRLLSECGDQPVLPAASPVAGA